MKIRELISKLKDIKEEHGNIDVCVYSKADLVFGAFYGYAETLDIMYVDKYGNNMPKNTKNTKKVVVLT